MYVDNVTNFDRYEFWLYFYPRISNENLQYFLYIRLYFEQNWKRAVKKLRNNIILNHGNTYMINIKPQYIVKIQYLTQVRVGM